MAKRNKKRPRQSTAEEPRRQNAHTKRRNKKRRKLLHLILLLLLLTAGIVLSLTVFFKIDAIVVVGSEQYSPEEIIAATGIQVDDNLFLVNTAKVRSHLLQSFPYLEEVKVTRTFPPTIEIHTTPSVAVAALEQSENNYVLISYQGKILERGLALPDWEALLVKGLLVGDMAPGDFLGEYSPEPRNKEESPAEKEARLERNTANEVIAEDQDYVLLMLHSLFSAMDTSGFADITNIDVSNRNSMEFMYENRMLIKLGSVTELSYKLSFAKNILDTTLAPDAPGKLDVAEVHRNRVYYKYPEGYREDGTRLEDPPFNPEQDGLEKSVDENTLLEEANPQEIEGTQGELIGSSDEDSTQSSLTEIIPDE